MEFEFNIRKARQSVVFLIFSSAFLISLIIITENKFSKSFSNFEELYLVLFFVYFLFLLFLISRLFHSFKKKKVSIVFNKKYISIPTFFLGEKFILLSDIYSVERRFLGKMPVSILIGIRNKGMYLVDYGRFVYPKEFDLFYSEIKKYLTLSGGPEHQNVINAIAGKQKNNKFLFSYIVVLIATILFFVGTNGRIEYSENIDLLVLGANTSDTILNKEFYRIASSTFLHASIFHLLLNLLMLALFSELLEKIISCVRFTNLFLISSTAAILTSSYFSNFDASVGASGGLFGLWGAYTYLKTRYEKYLPGSINAIPLKKLYIVLFAEILLEVFVIDNVDYINHLGGFVFGFLYIYFIPLGSKLEFIDKPTMPEKYIFAGFVAFYFVGLSYFLLMYYGLI